MIINLLLTSAQHVLDTVHQKHVRVIRLPFNCRVIVHLKNEVWTCWKIEIHKLDQIYGRSRRLCIKKNYSFFEETAVRYDEKPDKDRQICDMRDIVTRTNEMCLTVPLNQPAGDRIDCTIHVSEIYQTFPSKVDTQCTQRFKNISLKDICEATCK